MKTSLDLTPPRFRKQRFLMGQLRWWVVAAIGCVLFGGLQVGWSWRQYQLFNQQQAADEKAAAALQKMSDEIEQAKKRLKRRSAQQKKLGGDIASARSLLPKRNMVILLGLISRAIRAAENVAAGGPRGEFAGGPRGQVCLRDLQCDKAGAGSPRGFEDMRAARFSARIEGTAVDDVAVTRFVAALRDARAFTEVRLATSKSIQIHGTSARNFLLECVF